MLIKDYQCESCNEVFEVYVSDHKSIPEARPCQFCYGNAVKLITLNNTAPVDSQWISTVREVVNKESREPHCTEFLKHPTRSNYKSWMKGEGLRPLEPGEKALPTVDRESKLKHMKHKLKEAGRERRALTI